MSFFHKMDNLRPAQQEDVRIKLAGNASLYNADFSQLKMYLQELSGVASKKQLTISLPGADGVEHTYTIWETPIMEEGLASKYPTIKTFTGIDPLNPTVLVKLDYTELGFHAMVMNQATGNEYIDPYMYDNKSVYVVYRKKELLPKNHICYTQGIVDEEKKSTAAKPLYPGVCFGSQLRTFRLAIATTGEYAVAATKLATPTTAQVLSAVTTSVNRVSGVYESEIAVRLVLVSNTDQLFYTNGTSDPFTNTDPAKLINESQAQITATIGSASFDIGHTFSTGGGGLAGLGVVCNTTNKARGVTGITNPVGDAYDIDYVAHEMGHQLGADHTFNAATSSCNGNGVTNANAEPGSGSTIMAYAGICGSTNDLQAHSDPYFHAVSQYQIVSLINTVTCGTLINTNNTAPVVNAGSDYTIPISTPFILTGSATDANGDALTYDWEQVDVGSSFTNWNTQTILSPLFRSFVPSTSSTRYFPKLSDVIANTTTIGEVLPSISRNINMRLTVRDNKAGGGGVCFDDMKLTVDGSSGPFVVTSPNTSGLSWAGGSTQAVTWNVANTSNAPISCTKVAIQLSTDGGLTFPTTIIASTDNDGNETITVPSIITSKGRIRVIAVGNVFYDMSNFDITITTPIPDFDFSIPATSVVPCGSAQAVVPLNVSSLLGYVTPVALTATGNPTGTTVNFSNTTVTPGNPVTVTLTGLGNTSFGTYNVTVTGKSGTITHTRVLTFTLSPGAAPQITQQPVSKSVCESSSTSFSIAATHSAPFTYQWQVSVDGGNSFSDIAGATNSTYSLTGITKSLDTYKYRVKLISQCNVVFSNAATLTVNVNPVIGIAAAPYMQLYPGLTTTITAIVTTVANSTLTWSLNGTTLSNTANSYVADVSHLGEYMVSVVDANGCTATSNKIVISDSAQGKIFVYPNPSNGIFTVSYYNRGGNTTQQTVNIFSSNGQRVFQKTFSSTMPYQLLPINIWQLSGGIYILTVHDATGVIQGQVKLRIN